MNDLDDEESLRQECKHFCDDYTLIKTNLENFKNYFEAQRNFIDNYSVDKFTNINLNEYTNTSTENIENDWTKILKNLVEKVNGISKQCLCLNNGEQTNEHIQSISQSLKGILKDTQQVLIEIHKKYGLSNKNIFEDKKKIKSPSHDSSTKSDPVENIILFMLKNVSEALTLFESQFNQINESLISAESKFESLKTEKSEVITDLKNQIDKLNRENDKKIVIINDLQAKLKIKDEILNYKESQKLINTTVIGLQAEEQKLNSQNKQEFDNISVSKKQLNDVDNLQINEKNEMALKYQKIIQQLIKSQNKKEQNLKNEISRMKLLLDKNKENVPVPIKKLPQNKVEIYNCSTNLKV